MVASSLVRRRWRRCGLLSAGEKVNRLRAVCPALQGNRPHRAGHMLKTGSVETGSGLSLPHPSTRGGAQRAAPAVAPTWAPKAPIVNAFGTQAATRPTSVLSCPHILGSIQDGRRSSTPRDLCLLPRCPNHAGSRQTPELSAHATRPKQVRMTWG